MLAGNGSCHLISTAVAQAHKRLAQRDPCARMFTQARGQSSSADYAGLHQHLPETYVRTMTIGGHGVAAPRPWTVAAHRSRPRGTRRQSAAWADGCGMGRRILCLRIATSKINRVIGHLPLRLAPGYLPRNAWQACRIPAESPQLGFATLPAGSPHPGPYPLWARHTDDP